MAFDGFVLNAVISELKTNLIGGKIQKVYQPSSDEILLNIYASSLSYALILNISSNFYSVHLSTSKKDNPLVAPNFCMLLRKHIMGFKITNIDMIKSERIFMLELSGNDETYNPITKKLIVELMGKYSNILLLDNENTIIDSLKHFSISLGANRNVMPRALYELPTSNKIDISEYEDLKNNLDNSTLSNFFTEHFVGLSKTLVNYTIQDLKLDDILTTDNYIKLSNYFVNLKNACENRQVECITFENDYTLKISNSSKPLQVNMFLDDYYFKKENDEQFLSYRNQLLQFILGRLKRISKKLSAIDIKLKECEDLEKYKLYGELITSFLYQITDEHSTTISLPNYYDNNNIINIPLDISISPAENAKKYFKKYHKLKNAFSIVQEQKIDLEKEINYLESIVYELQSAENIKDLDEIYDEIEVSFSNSQKQKNKKQPKHKKTKKLSGSAEPILYNIENFKVLVGKNNKQNDKLTFKIANKEDIWFHVKDIHGSHVILVTDGKTPSQDIINKCAAITAYYSKAKESSNVPVDYTLIKYVKKPSNSKSGMVVYTNQKTVNVKPSI